MLCILPDIVDEAAAAPDIRNIVGAIENLGQSIAVPLIRCITIAIERDAILLLDPPKCILAVNRLKPEAWIVIRCFNRWLFAVGHRQSPSFNREWVGDFVYAFCLYPSISRG